MTIQLKWGVLLCICMLAAWPGQMACDDGGGGDGDTDSDGDSDTDSDSDSDTDSDTDSDSDTDTDADTYSVSGTAGRVAGTCPDAYGSIGTLCVSIRSDCADIATEVASTSVASADMSLPVDGPSGFQSDPVDFSVADVPDGTWQVHAFLDLDGAGCGDDLATGDLVDDPPCLEVAVSGADVSDVTFEFIIVTP